MLKSVSSITNAIGALNYKGTWDALINDPTLASGVGVKGDYYVVSVAGFTNLDGITNWGIGDWAVFNGSVWQRVEGGADLNGVNLTVTNDALINLVYIGRGGGNVASNTRVGNEALANNTNGFSNTAFGKSALNSNTTGDFNTASGFTALASNVGGNNNTAFGALALSDQPLGNNNTAVGYAAGYVLTGASNTLVGAQAGFDLTTGADNNTLLGATAGLEITTGAGNVVIGNYTGNDLFLDIRLLNNHAVISDGAGTIKQYWDASGNSVQLNGGLTVPNDSRFNQVYVGHGGGDIASNTRVGEEALKDNTSGFSNTAIGKSALTANTTGDWNTSVGFIASGSTLVGNYNTAVGALAMGDQATGDNNTAVGASAGYILQGAGNTLVGYQAGFDLSTADNNTLIGATAGAEITTGDGNVVVGNYDGNNGTLDIRTTNNYVVLSDGAGNIKQYWDGSGNSTQPAGNFTVAGDVDSTSGSVSAAAYKLKSGGIITEAGTTRTLSAGDNGKVIYCTSGSAVTITCATGLGAGFSCTIVQAGAGKVTVAAGAATLNSYSGLLSTMGQYAVISLISPVADSFIAAGNLGV